MLRVDLPRERLPDRRAVPLQYAHVPGAVVVLRAAWREAKARAVVERQACTCGHDIALCGAHAAGQG